MSKQRGSRGGTPYWPHDMVVMYGVAPSSHLPDPQITEPAKQPTVIPDPKRPPPREWPTKPVQRSPLQPSIVQRLREEAQARYAKGEHETALELFVIADKLEKILK